MNAFSDSKTSSSTFPRNARLSLVAAAAIAGVISLSMHGISTADEATARAKRDKAKTKNADADSVTLGKRWTVLHRPQQGGVNVSPIPKNSPLEVVNGFELTGPAPGDPFLFGHYKSQGEWGLVNGTLKPVSGRHTACRLSRAGDFELEGLFDAEGLGGWFFLIGWDMGHGYMIYNVNLKVSGSPWLVVEFRGSRGIEETHREFHRYQWQGQQPLQMVVANQELSLRAGQEIITQNLPLPNYHEGDVIVGTYDTRYGPKPLQIHSLRMRAR